MRLILPALLACCLLHCSAWAQDLKTPFETKGPNYTATYDEVIGFYTDLAAASPTVKLVTYPDGTDAGRPLHLVVISKPKLFNPVPLRQADYRFVMINNGIHPGEPDGIESSMLLARDLVTDARFAPLLDHIVLLIIPTYNVDGTLNRNATSRANQNGPAEYGFRGNGRNLDLNRDFIKCDSRNARSFTKIYTEWRPDVFIDTHTSNGADYPYTMTYIATQPDKFDPGLGQYMTSTLNPELVKYMAEVTYDMCPYVQTPRWTTPPDSGIIGFLETPRYSTGYAALYNAIGYTSEAHMLKPFEDRVNATYHFCLQTLKAVNRDRKLIVRLRKEADELVKKQEAFTIRWQLDLQRSDKLNFKGYAAVTQPSPVTGFPRMTYDRNQSWQKDIPYFNHYKPEVTVKKPVAYLLPQAWGEAVERMKLNGVEMQRLSEDVDLDVTVYLIDSFSPARLPYEGHYPLTGVKVHPVAQTIRYLAGDYVIYVNQVANRYIVETLEPQAHDSYFHWNFFDEILGQKEYFSPYIFDATAAQFLDANPTIKAEFQKKVQSDPDFAKDDYGQLNWIYKRTPLYEPGHLRYPVARIEKVQKIPLQK
jgi:hypothetical protein